MEVLFLGLKLAYDDPLADGRCPRTADGELDWVFPKETLDGLRRDMRLGLAWVEPLLLFLLLPFLLSAALRIPAHVRPQVG